MKKLLILALLAFTSFFAKATDLIVEEFGSWFKGSRLAPVNPGKPGTRYAPRYLKRRQSIRYLRTL